MIERAWAGWDAPMEWRQTPRGLRAEMAARAAVGCGRRVTGRLFPEARGSLLAAAEKRGRTQV